MVERIILVYKNIYYDGSKIHLWEITEEGKTKRIVENFEYEYYVEDKSKKSPIKDIYGNPFIRRTAKSSKELYGLRKSGLKLCESDLKEEVKFLQNRYKGKQLKVDIKNFRIAAIDIELAVEGSHTTSLLVEHPINLITLIVRTPKADRVFTFATQEYTSDSKEYVDDYRCYPTELEMIEAFVEFFRKCKIDIISGYNIVLFDIPYIINRIKKLTKNTNKEGIENKLSAVDVLKYNEKDNTYKIMALTIIDYYDLIKKFTFETLPSYTLNNVSKHFLNSSKISYEGTIKDFYKTNWNGFVDYNIQDAKLILQLEDKLKFIELAIYRSYMSLNPLENFHSPILIWTGNILKYLHERNMVLPDKPKNIKDWWKHDKMYIFNNEKQNTIEGEEEVFGDFFIKGGHVEAYPGFYFKVLSFDARALYPSNIILYNISPETKVTKPTDINGLIRSTINGVFYTKDKGILPTIIEESLKERDYHKSLSEKYFNEGNKDLSDYHNYLQMVFKINNNSAYGALCNKNFHLFDVDNARAITRGGRVIIRYLAKNVNRYLKEFLHNDYKKYFPDCKEPRKIESDSVTLCDTDSIYVTINDVYDIYNNGESFLEFAYKIEKKLFEPLLDSLVKRFAKLHSSNGSIFFKREGIISKQIVLGKKKYFTELLQKEGKIFKEPKPDATGLETERSNFPSFCQDRVWETFESVFENINSKSDLKNPEAKKIITDLVRLSKEDFIKASVEDISMVSSVQKYDESCKSGEWYVKNGLKFKGSLPIYYRAACVYNYVVKKYKLPLVEITGGDKIKYIYVYPNNSTQNNVVAYIGNYPKEFESIFKIDYETQFEKTYFSVLQRLYEVLGWGRIEMRDNLLKQFKRKI